MITFINDTLIRLIEVTMTSRYLNNLIDLLITIWRVKPEYLETAINSTVPTYGDDAGIWTRETMVRGKCSYHCTTPALHPCSLNWCITNQSAFIKRLLNKKGVGHISLALVCMMKYTLIAWFSFLLKKCLYEVNQPWSACWDLLSSDQKITANGATCILILTQQQFYTETKHDPRQPG